LSDLKYVVVIDCVISVSEFRDGVDDVGSHIDRVQKSTQVIIALVMEWSLSFSNTPFVIQRDRGQKHTDSRNNTLDYG